MNYLISESQLQSLVSVEKPVMSFRSALKKIVDVLKKDDYESEQIMDFILGLRYKDEFTIRRAQKYKDDPEFLLAISKIIQGNS
jgi:hypothetical protein